jgi:tetratricopeptide (TPR) repeat protein
MKVEELKEQARLHEQREEWPKALDLYGAALRKQDHDEAPDISLYNRVGDIQTRLGQANSAVEHYEKAIDLYLEAELPNNAIAICKKVLRNFPERSAFFRRMGQIRASQGFLTDARQNFLTYAERTTESGDIESALSALVEFVELSPNDVEIRRGLAFQLEAHDRVEEAVEHFHEAYRLLLLGDREPEADAIAQKLGELAPELLLPDLDALLAETAAEEEEEFVLESTSLDTLDSGARDREPEGIPEAGHLEIPDFVDAAQEVESGVTSTPQSLGWDDEDAAQTLDDLGLMLDSEQEAEGELEFLHTLDVEGEEEEEWPEGELEPLPSLVMEDQEEEPEGELEPLPSLVMEDQEEEPEGELEPLPSLVMEDQEEEPEGELEPLPSLAMEDQEVELELSPTPGVEEEEEEGEDLETAPVLGSEELGGEETGFDTAAVGLASYEEAAEEGDLDLALELVRDLIRSEPDDVELHQRLVEYAFRKSDDATLSQAYLELAGCLARIGTPVKAKAVYNQVLALSPGNEEALRGLRELEGSAKEAAPVEVVSSQEYVDLGALVLGDEGEKTTRWTVAADEPSGDDQADFAKMLSQFKEKVSEHLAVDDVAAHHDLGTAYLEMGLLDEAIAEFQMALRASPGHLPTHELMGRCWLEREEPDMAVRALTRALSVPFEVEEELIGIYYLMGRAKEDLGKTEEAIEFYDKVFSLDINFEDVTERLRALR